MDPVLAVELFKVLEKINATLGQHATSVDKIHTEIVALLYDGRKHAARALPLCLAEQLERIEAQICRSSRQKETVDYIVQQLAVRPHVELGSLDERLFTVLGQSHKICFGDEGCTGACEGRLFVNENEYYNHLKESVQIALKKERTESFQKRNKTDDVKA